ncbi:hypothetical protein GIB67_013806 [Kingdonia uniflora]|uniref:Uncharacterized protein n=1 Tax=Kingdonia uniflora TaxID=39325 RepID=A0A7J7N7J8_9MAGN|nr:hypothetical protein GIB67_013806 [Kingdonia uniflora]
MAHEDGDVSGVGIGIGKGRELVVANVLPVREAPPDLEYRLYPTPLATYEEVKANPNLFMSTLEKLHATMVTKFMIPVIGGKELDLHRLFVEVTSRGGIDQIVRERRWKEVTAVFNFPSTATNASFVLRKYYVSLLHHYEKMHFFRETGWTDHSSSPSPSPNVAQRYAEPLVSSSKAQKRIKVSHSLGCPVTGVIDGKFDYGYLVTVTIGTQKLQGVLYHLPEHHSGKPVHPGIISNSGNTVQRRRRRRKKSEMKKRDPAHPKPNRSGYNFFFAEQHARLKPLHPGKDREISKMIGELWSKLTETEKAVYQEQGLKDKERYISEMTDYRESLTKKQVISGAVPIQQRLAVPEADVAMLDAEEGDDSPQTPEEDDGSSSHSSDSEEEKTAEKDLEMEVSAVAASNGIHTADVVEDLASELDRDEKVGEKSSSNE